MAAFLGLPVGASAQWNWNNPLPQGNTLHDVQFVNASTGFAVGDGGTILKTTDGGYNWNRTERDAAESLNAVFFLDSLTGYALSNEGPSLYKTTDGGVTWTLHYNFSTFEMNDIWFTTPLHGVAVGYESVFVTNDGGITWGWYPPYSWNYSIWFTGASTAFMCSDGALSKSYDGGDTWIVKRPNVDGWLGSFFFMNADTGLHVGRGGRIFRTSDAGEHWDSIYSGTQNLLSAAYMFPNGIGYAVGNAGTMLKTTNAGRSWITLPSITDYNLETITFSDASHGVITGELGILLITEDGGLSWMIISTTATKKNLNAVSFPDANTGYAAGANATILKSTDGGILWQALSIPGNADFSSMFFNDTQTGYVAGTSGTLYKTADGGGSWNALTTGINYDLQDVAFPDYQTGYAIGYPGNFYDSAYLLKTNNAGVSWATKSGFDFRVQAMVFTSPDTGYIAGSGNILKTVDGGVSWSLQGNYPGIYFYDLCFPTRNKGFACGYKAIYTTTDAGVHWNVFYSGELIFSRMVFPDALHGYVLASGLNTGSWMIYKTEDGGDTWSQKPVNRTSYFLNDLFFKDSDTGLIVGNNGVILKTVNGGGIITGVQPPPLPANSSISMFPVPCRNHVKLDFPELENSVSVKVYSLAGKELFSAEFTRVRNVTIALPPLPDGIYLVKIKTGSEMVVKKLAVSNAL
ncbi:MAG: YCF48-related protein [Bacteroidetes bacterium]|nr:YCF48-related protein [Bacteroidota bacterium]